MNPLLNPYTSLNLIYNYMRDPGRIKRLNQKELERYRSKKFKQIVKYAYNVPLYHEKYKKVGIHPSDIKGINDIIKLPFINKKDLLENFPDNIIPIGYNKNKSFIICTGGTTGKPVSIYIDFQTMGKAAGITVREMNFFNLNWRKSRFVHIGNFNKYRIDLIAQENFKSHIESFISMKNHLNIDVNLSMINMIKKLDRFQPDIIMSYPAIFQHLAFLKRKGYGKNIKPKLFWTGGAILDDYTKNYVEDAFGCKLLNVYPSVEAGADIAFECLHGNWHVHSDFFNIEVVDENNELLSEGERGHIVLTRLWGKGTPIIRYTGMDDWARLIHFKECKCGLKTPIIKGGIEGRMRANIVLPDGKIFPPGAFCFITPILLKLKTFKVKQYQIIQKKINEIDILLVIDNDLRNVGPSVETIFKKIKEVYQSKVGTDVKINIVEVDKVKNLNDSSKPPPIVMSHIKPEGGYRILELKK